MSTLSKFLNTNLNIQKAIPHLKEIEEWYQSRLDMKFAIKEVTYLMRKEKRRCSFSTQGSGTHLQQRHCKNAWVAVTINEDLLKNKNLRKKFVDLTMKYQPPIWEYKLQCPEKCSGYYDGFTDVIYHMIKIHKIKINRVEPTSIQKDTFTDRRLIHSTNKPIAVFCMKKDVFQAMSMRTKKYILDPTTIFLQDESINVTETNSVKEPHPKTKRRSAKEDQLLRSRLDKIYNFLWSQF